MKRALTVFLLIFILLGMTACTVKDKNDEAVFKDDVISENTSNDNSSGKESHAAEDYDNVKQDSDKNNPEANTSVKQDDGTSAKNAELNTNNIIADYVNDDNKNDAGKMNTDASNAGTDEISTDEVTVYDTAKKDADANGTGKNTAVEKETGTDEVAAKTVDAIEAVDNNKTGDTAGNIGDKELSELEKLSKTLALQMNEGEFKEIYNTLSPFVKLQLTEKVLEQAWNTVATGLGTYKGTRKITEEIAGTNTIVTVILDYDHSGIQVLFSYNADKKLDGFWINYAPFKPEPVSNKDFEETAITFGDGKNPVKGILTLPKNVKNPPVAILVPGSGDNDADESVGANKPFRDLAHGLARRGIAVIRYNESTPRNTKPDFTIQDDSLNDASLAIKYVNTLKSVDKKKVFIIGHSLGGMMAPKIATDNKEVKGIVCLAGSPRKLEDIIVDQNRILLGANKSVTPESLKIHMTQVQAAANKIKNLKEGGSEIILEYPASYWFSLNRIDIPSIAKKLNIPILIAQGSADFQVYADIDYVAWQNLLKDRDNVTFRLYDNLNHLFMKSNGKMDTTEYNIKGTVDSQVIEDIAEWIYRMSDT